MGVREAINKKPWLSVGLAICFLGSAFGVIVYSQWPEHHFSGKSAFFSDDDGNTWFIDSVYKTAPFDHDGKQAVRAVIYSYDHGSKEFCAYLMRYKASDNKRLADALADAAKAGKPPSSVQLFEDKGILDSMEVKQPGPGHPWVAVLSPEGSDAANAVLKNYDDGTLDVVYPE